MTNTNSTLKPVIAVGTLGGTITMTASQPDEGVQSTLGAEQLMSAIPGLERVGVELRLQTLANMASGSIRFADLFKVLQWASKQVEQGAAGVVIVQGTDTLEESAFFLDLYWPYAEPLVLTGAMRSPTQAGAEGSANLLAAVQVAQSSAACNYGVVVVMNDEIHEARLVRKVHTTALNAFTSPVLGPVGAVREGQARFFRLAHPRTLLPIPPVVLEVEQDANIAQTLSASGAVLLLESSLDENPIIYTRLAELGYAGLVIAGYGSGHVSIPVRVALTEVVSQMPVLMASRTGAGSTTRAVYAYPGSEIDLQQRGVMMVGSLCPRKARLLLNAYLWQNLSRTELLQALNKHLAHYDAI